MPKNYDSRTTSGDTSSTRRLGRDTRESTSVSEGGELSSSIDTGTTLGTEKTTREGETIKYANIAATISFKIKIHGRFPTGEPGKC